MAGYAIPIGGGLTFTARQDRQAWAALVQPGAAGLQVAPGVRPGPGLDVSVSSGTITVTPGAAIVQSAASAVAGAYRAWIDANWTTTLTAADASNPRSDLVYLRVRDTDEDGSGSRDCTPVYVAGTPAASPTTPSIPVGTSGIVLGVIAVPKSGSGSPTVSTTTRPLLAATGGVTPTPSGLLSVSGLFIGQARFNYTRALPEYWDGSNWIGQGDWSSHTPVWTASGSAPSIGNGTLASRWSRVGRTIHWNGSLVCGSTTGGGTGFWSMSLPVAAAANSLTTQGVADYNNFTDNEYLGVCAIASGGSTAVFTVKTVTSSSSAGNVSSTVPVAISSNARLHWGITYEAAS